MIIKKSIPVVSFIIIIMILQFFIFSGITYSSKLENDISQIEELIIEEEAMEPEWIDPNAEQTNNYINSRIRGEGRSLLGKYNGLTYYSQADKRWANDLYTSTNNKSQTMKSSGCGPTAAAIVVSSSIGSITPIKMADLFVQNGFRTANNGTSWSAFPFVANYFGFNSYDYTTNINTALEYLKNGYYIIVSCGKGLFTTNGHYIVLVGINENTLSIYDTYLYNGKFDTSSRKGKVSVSGNTVFCTIDNFKKYANYRAFWCYSNDNGKNNTSTNNNIKPHKTYSIGNYQITASILRVRSGPGTNYKIVSRIKKGSRYKIDKVNGNWGHLSNNKGWICLDYCNKVTSSDNPPKNKTSGKYKIVTKSLPLRIRKGPGTNYKTVGKVFKGSIVSINYTKGNWGHLKNNKGWIYLGYCKKI